MTDDFGSLANMMNSYLGQDMELIAPTVPAAIAEFVRTSSQCEREDVLNNMDQFMQRYREGADAEFAQRWDRAYTPENQTLAEFFALIREIFADPECYKRWE